MGQSTHFDHKLRPSVHSAYLGYPSEKGAQLRRIGSLLGVGGALDRKGSRSLRGGQYRVLARATAYLLRACLKVSEQSEQRSEMAHRSRRDQRFTHLGSTSPLLYRPYALLALCARALSFDVIEVPRIERMLKDTRRIEDQGEQRGQLILLPSRFARDAQSFATRAQKEPLKESQKVPLVATEKGGDR